MSVVLRRALGPRARGDGRLGLYRDTAPPTWRGSDGGFVDISTLSLSKTRRVVNVTVTALYMNPGSEKCSGWLGPLWQPAFRWPPVTASTSFLPRGSRIGLCDQRWHLGD